jgi:transposase
MAFREVTMLEVKEVLRLWLGGAPKKRISAQLGLNVKTVRRYIGAARAEGLARETGPEALDDGLIATVVSRAQPERRPPPRRGLGECVTQRAVIEPHLRGGVRLSKVQTLLRRQGWSSAAPPSGASPWPSSARPVDAHDPCGRLRARGRGPSRHRLDDAPRGRPRHRSPTPLPGDGAPPRTFLRKGDTRKWLDRPLARYEARRPCASSPVPRDSRRTAWHRLPLRPYNHPAAPMWASPNPVT